MHAAVVTGVLPLGTAIAAALWLRQRASIGFWLCAVIGCALVLAFAVYRGRGSLSAADGLLLLAVASASIGYVAGAQVATKLPAEHVICWVLVMSLPLTLPAMLATWPAGAGAVRLSAWVGLAYVTLFSMWLGFFAWYRGLALGGVLRVSQVQLLQPFLALLFAVPVLGERLDAMTMAFALPVMAVVFIGKHMPVRRSPETHESIDTPAKADQQYQESPTMNTNPQPFTLARRAERMNPSVIREILKVTERPGIVSLAGGLPSADTFPVQAVRDASEKVLREAPREALQYAASEGYRAAARVGRIASATAARHARAMPTRC